MPAHAGRIRALVICGAVTGSLVLAAPADRAPISLGQMPAQAPTPLERVAREAVNKAFQEDGATWGGERDADGSVILRSPDGSGVVFAKTDGSVEIWRRKYDGEWEHGAIRNGTLLMFNLGKETHRPPRCRPGGVVQLPPTAGPNAPKPPIAAPPVLPPGGEPLPPSQVREFQQKFIDDLSAKAKAVTGTKDAKGNFVVDGIAISPTTVNGLILTKDTFISDLDGWIAEIDRVQSLPLHDKQQFVQQLFSGPEVSKLYDEYKKFMRASAQAQGLHDEPHQYYLERMKIADELERLEREHPGTKAERAGLTATDYRQLAMDSPYGWFVTMQHRFYELLSKNKLLAIRKDGKYLFEALQEGPNGLSLQGRMDLINDYLDAGRETAKQQKKKAVGDTSIDALMKYGGPQYSTQHIKAAAIGKTMGATLPQLEISEVQAVFQGVTLSNEFWDSLEEGLLNAAMAGSILLPGGPLIAAGIAVIQITRDGTDLVVSLLTEEEAKRNASVSGYQYVITAQDRVEAAKGKLLITVAMSVPNLIGLAEIKNIKLLKGTKGAAGSGGAAVNAAGTAVKAAGSIDAGLEAITAEFGKEVADGVRAARQLGVSEGEIQSMLKIAHVDGEAATMPHGQMVKMAASEYPAISNKGLDLLKTVQNAAAVRHLLSDLAKVEELIATARGLGLPDEVIQAALKAARAKNSIPALTELLARDIQIAEINLKEGVILVDSEIPEASLLNRQPMSTADLVENYANTIKPKSVQDVHFGVDVLDSVAAKVEVGANSGAMGVELTPEQWFAANSMAEYPGKLEQFYKLNPDQNGFVQVFDKGFNTKFEKFLETQAQTDARARAILAKWNARKEALASAPKPLPVLPRPDQIPEVLRNPVTGDFISPDAIMRLTEQDLAKIPGTFSINERVPDAVAKAFGRRVTKLFRESNAAKAAAVPAFPVPKIGFNVESRIQRLTNQIILDAEHFSAGVDALEGGVRHWSNSRVAGFVVRGPSDPADVASYHQLTHPEFAALPERGSAISFGLFDEVCADPMTVEPPDSVNMLAANGAPDFDPQKFAALLHLLGAVPGSQPFESRPGIAERLLRRALAFIEPGVSAEAALAAAGQSSLKVALVSLGVATGEAFDVSVINDGNQPVTLDADGIVLEAVAKGNQDKVAKQFADAIKARGARAPAPTVGRIEAYCLDYDKPPPRAGTIFRIANSATQVKNGWMRQLLQAEQRLEKSGAIQPGANPEATYRTLRQWTIWAYAQHFTRDGFLTAFVDHARKNFAAAGKPFTATIAADVSAQAAQFHQAVTAVIHDAHLDIVK